MLGKIFTEGQNLEDEAVKMHLDDREKKRLVEDYLELTKAASKTDKVTSNVDANFVLPDF